MKKQALLSLENIFLSIKAKTILQDISLQLMADEIVTLIGPNGAGKSTLLRIILGLQAPSKGRVYRRPGLKIGYMPQQLPLDPFMPLSVRRFLALSPYHNHADLQAILVELSIAHLAHTPMQNVSGGELQRILLARALLAKPDVLVLDEPAQGVDVLGQEELYALIRIIRQKWGCGILMVSHDLHLVMAGTDSVICLNKHICCQGSPECVSQDNEFLRLFGLSQVKGLALYAHHHNHQHHLDGEICN